MFFRKKSSHKKIPFRKSNTFFWMVVLFILTFRWIGWDHFVIPSSSMVPNLLIFDHIVVNKFQYGMRIPFTKKWIWKNKLPKRGDVVVFRSVRGNYFMVKRVIGLPGDHVRIQGEGVWVNKEKIKTTMLKKDDPSYYPITDFELGDSIDRYNLILEEPDHKSYRVMWDKEKAYSYDQSFDVPQNQLFLLGDNRNNSQDSRYWGFLPLENLMGQAQAIWMSCEQTLFNLPLLCYPWTLRWKRIFSALN